MSDAKETIASLQKALALVPEVSISPLDGDYRLYSRGRLFGIVRKGELFLKFLPETLCLYRDISVHTLPGGFKACKANQEWLSDPEKLGEAALFTLAAHSPAKSGCEPVKKSGKRWFQRLPWERALAACVALVLLYLILPHGMLRAVGIQKGSRAENLALTGADGGKIWLSDCEGKPALIYHWETNSQRAIDTLPMLDSLYADYKDRPVCFLPVTIISEFDPNVKAFATAKDLKFPIYKAGGGFLAGKRAPMLYLIDHEGYIRKSYSPHTGDQARIASDLEALLRAVPAAAVPPRI